LSATLPKAHRGLGPRVALIRSRYDPFGGAERFVQGAVAALRARGASLTIITRHWPDQDGTAIVLDPFYAGSLWRDWGFARAVQRELGKRHFDLVQAHERIPGCDLYRAGDGVHAEWLAQRERVQSGLATFATRLSPHHRYVLWAEYALFTSPKLRAVICNSEMVREEIAKQFATSYDKLVLIRNAVDGAKFHPGLRGEMREGVRQQLRLPPSANVVLHVGSGFERKGVSALLQALALPGATHSAIIVGKDKHAERYAGQARRLGIAERVRFVGAVSDVRPYYAAADSFALPTLYDPCPNAALEAMACGLPVVTTRKCGAAELLREGESGFVHDALDIAALGAALARLDPVTAARMGSAAREAVAKLTPEAMAGEYLALYERMLSR
jgi:UDP-glucose:(heptosyl)LPS alpha-1,3-glucosyltransferase